MARPKGITLTDDESQVFIGWRDARPGSTDSLAAHIGVTREHLSRFLHGRVSLARDRFYRLLRVMREESSFELAKLEIVGSPGVQDAIRSVRSLKVSEPPRAGRGRAVAASIA
ncbi:MAG: hypothetical protein Rubg2KO_15160 [Rubricoccaceae bacterium]